MLFEIKKKSRFMTKQRILENTIITTTLPIIAILNKRPFWNIYCEYIELK